MARNIVTAKQHMSCSNLNGSLTLSRFHYGHLIDKKHKIQHSYTTIKNRNTYYG